MAQNMTEPHEEPMIPMPAPIPEGLVAATPQALLVEGGVACGKTQALVERAVDLITSGADARDVLVLCATPNAAARFAERLAAACPAAAQVRATTPRELALEVLATPEAQAAAGFGGRMLAPFEVDFLMEDMKTGGMRPKRLREMLRFFYKSITELCDWDDEWLVTGEEELTFGLLRDCLRFTGGILEPQVANVAARYLKNNGGALADWQVAHVLADDYQMLSRASQVLANMLATTSIAVATNPDLCVEVFDSYPYAAGIEEFRTANPQAEHVVLNSSHACGAAVRAVNGIAREQGLNEVASSATGELTTLLGDNPGLERDAVVEFVHAAIASGANPGGIALVTPNNVWARNLEAALSVTGAPVERLLDERCASGDLRTVERCAVARLITALYLVADPHDGVAWRSWCGFGEHFAASSAFASVRTFGLAAGLGVSEALASHAQIAADSGVNRAEHAHVEDALALAARVQAAAQGLLGTELLKAIASVVLGEGAQVPTTVLELAAPLPNGALAGDDAASMASRARLRLAAPRTTHADRVLLCTLKDLTGLTPHTLVLCGMVNGFFPERGVLERDLMVQEEADKQSAKDLRLLANAAGKPTHALVASYFTQADLEVAERLKMKIRRIQLHGSRRVALTQPSAYLELMRD